MGERMEAEAWQFAEDRASPAEDYAYRLECDAWDSLVEFGASHAQVLAYKAARILLMCRGMWIE